MAEWWQVNIPRAVPAEVADTPAGAPGAGFAGARARVPGAVAAPPSDTASPGDVLAYWTRVMGDTNEAQSSRLKASEYLAKHHGMLIERTETRDTTPDRFADVPSNVLGALLEALKARSAVDVTPEPKLLEAETELSPENKPK